MCVCLVVSSFCNGIRLYSPICGVIVSMLASGAEDCGFESRSRPTKGFEIGICCFSSKHAALRRKGTDRLARNQDNVSEWSDMSTRELFFR